MVIILELKMKKFHIATLLTLMILTGCSDSLSPTENPDFSEIQFKVDSWSAWGIRWSRMELYKSGWVKIDVFHRDGSNEGIEINMNSSEMKIFRTMENDFSSYGSYYSPDPWPTDQAYHNIILIREIPDTTGVYAGGGNNLPKSLRNGIKSMEDIELRARGGIEG